MAFPTTSLLDDFTTDEAPISTNWTTPLFTGESTTKKLSGQFQWNAGSGAGGATYDLQTFGPDCEAWVTLATIPATGQNCSLWLRVSAVPLNTGNGYFISYLPQDPATDIVRIRKLVAGAASTLGSDISQDFVNGDGFGAACIGSTIQVFRRSGGVWSLLDSRTDSSVTAAGYIGLEVSNASATRLDDFGGGTVGAALTATSARLMLLGVG